VPETGFWGMELGNEILVRSDLVVGIPSNCLLVFQNRVGLVSRASMEYRFEQIAVVLFQVTLC
jgi:hypothetical protein